MLPICVSPLPWITHAHYHFTIRSFPISSLTKAALGDVVIRVIDLPSKNFHLLLVVVLLPSQLLLLLLNLLIRYSELHYLLTYGFLQAA